VPAIVHRDMQSGSSSDDLRRDWGSAEYRPYYMQGPCKVALLVLGFVIRWHLGYALALAATAGLDVDVL
jgi:hypothetical protein